MNFHEDSRTFAPVDLKMIESINASLRQNRFSELPKDYIDLLSKTNGYIYYDLEFYGTISANIHGRFFSFPNILKYNKIFDEHPFMIGKIIIGQDSQSVFVYDEIKKVYLLCDRISFTPIEAFKTFSDLMKKVSPS